MPLTKTERLILANQQKVLALLNPDEAPYHESVQEALLRGYVSAYEQMFDEVDDEFTIEQCQFVGDALTVYEALQLSYDALEDKSGIEPRQVLFIGFDGNNESAYLGYARYVRQKEGRWDYLRVASKDLNSHMPVVPIYERMIAKHKEFGERLDLSRDQLMGILGSVHP
jgi:uncharacterized protein YfbU (UPF0304 family)